MMKHLRVNLENCYGIRKLEFDFNLGEQRQYAIYAPNGVMKSSLAKCFQDVADGQNSGDRIYPARQTVREIVDENGKQLDSANVFVVEPYNETYRSNRMSTLLANQALRQRYDKVRELIDQKSDVLIGAISSASGLKKGAAERMSKDVAQDPNDFMTAIARLAQEVADNAYPHLADIEYAKVFNEKVEAQILNADIQGGLAEYMAAYDQLVAGSYFFRKGIFNHNNASDVAKNLKANGFFKADHSVYVNNKDVRTEIKTEADLEKHIELEKASILGDPKLVAAFDKIDKILSKNADVKEFRDYLAANEKLLPELTKPERLKTRLWAAYMSASKSAYDDLVATFAKGKVELEAVISEAKAQATRWAEVIAEFNERFSVPFIVTVENQHDVILKADAPSIRFRFRDQGADEVQVDEGSLRAVLSGGEKRALYLLNIIFEVIARREAGVETLFVMDDIADSFDYKNKYAIVEYLSDIADESNFYQLILTHNYDFFRTVSKRLHLMREHKLHTVKNATAVSLKQEKYQNNPFRHWKDNLAAAGNDDFVVAMVPFARNIAEYTDRPDVENALTGFLHIKAGSENLTLNDLQALMAEVMHFPAGFALPDGARTFFDVLTQRAKATCAMKDEEIELESKIVLAIAIRLEAERFMIKNIADQAFVGAITKNQTSALFQQYRKEHPGEKDALSILKQVNLMTPENIHINSFMYEPILDMANDHLRKLYDKVLKMNGA